jgi:drug/metabolite transporter (DMT)-like permease
MYILAITSLSSSANLIRLAGAPAEMIGFWRLLASALILLPLALKTGDLKLHFKKPTFELAMVFLSGLFFFGHLWTYFYSAQNTRIANCMIIFALNPLFVSLASYFVFREKLSARIFLAYVFAAIGVYELVSHSLSFEQGFVKGDLAALLSAVLFSAYLVTGKKARMSIANSAYTFLAYSLTAVLFGAATMASGVPFIGYTSLTWLAILLSVIFPTMLGHVMFSYLMKRMNLNFMSCGKLLEPALSSVMAYMIFREELTVSAMWAFFFTAIAVLILFLPMGNISFFKSKFSKIY